MRIKTSIYNEVAPEEIGKLLADGALIRKSQVRCGVYIGTYFQKTGRVTVYSDDDILYHNIILPLSIQRECSMAI